MTTIADNPLELERLLRQPAIEMASRPSLVVRVVEGLFGTVALIGLIGHDSRDSVGAICCTWLSLGIE